MLAQTQAQTLALASLFSVFLMCQTHLSCEEIQTKWHVKTSPHFEIYHESNWTPTIITLELEKIYTKMRLNMAMFAPWVVKEKVKVYIYQNQKTYSSGEFHPPKWSNGMAFVKKKTVVTFDPGNIDKLREVIVHEITHLCFESFFGEVLKYPPLWLNEGLAVYMGDLTYPRAGVWSIALKYIPRERLFRFEKFFTFNLKNIDSKQKVGDWYLQAFGIVSFFYQTKTRLQFKNFCNLIRDGRSIEKALWEVYKYPNIKEFESAWLGWHKNYNEKQNIQSGRDFPSASFNFTPIQFSSFNFKKF
jgi:hypothetical protein